MYRSQALDYKSRAPVLVKKLVIYSVALAIILPMLSVIILGVTRTPITQDNLTKTILSCFLFLGPPVLIVPFLDLFFSDNNNWYMGAGIYYGGAILCRIIGIPWGFLVATFIVYKFTKYLNSGSRPW